MDDELNVHCVPFTDRYTWLIFISLPKELEV